MRSTMKLLILILALSVTSACLAQKKYGLTYGVGLKGSWPVGQLKTTHNNGFGGDFMLKYLPKESSSDFIYIPFVYTLSIGYSSHPGFDSVNAGQTIKRSNFQTLPILFGMWARTHQFTYIHIQAGWSNNSYNGSYGVFVYALELGLTLYGIDLGARFQGMPSQKYQTANFLEIRLGINSGGFNVRY